MNAMKIFSFLILALCAEQNIFTAASTQDKISYEDLVNMNGSCFPRDTCEGRTGIFYNEFRKYACSCDRSCSKMGVCCIDSPHKGLYPMVESTCRTVGHCEPPDSFLMVDRCMADIDTNPLWKSLCETEKEDDIMKIAPVTSVSTSVTYKNYFCFRCHESTDDFFYWTAKFQNSEDIDFDIDSERFNVTYDHHNESWVAVDGNGTSFSVKYSFKIPYDKRNLAVPCALGVISECSLSWTDENVRNLCKSYAATVYKLNNWSFTKYKNVHCAICNFLRVEDMHCVEDNILVCGFPIPFEKLFDLNSVGRNEKCEKNFEWDPLAKKCRKFGCVIPGYVVKNGKCVPP